MSVLNNALTRLRHLRSIIDVGALLLSLHLYHMQLNGSQLTKLKRVFLSWYFHEIDKLEAIGLINYNYTLKTNTIFVNM